MRSTLPLDVGFQRSIPGVGCEYFTNYSIVKILFKSALSTDFTPSDNEFSLIIRVLRTISDYPIETAVKTLRTME